MLVRMRMHDASFVPVAMRVDETSLTQQVFVGQQVVRRTGGSQPALMKDETIIGDLFENRKIVSRGDYGALSPAIEEIFDHEITAPRIEARGRFVEQKHIRFRDHDAGQRDALFFSLRQPVRRALGEMGESHRFQESNHLRADFIVRPAQLQGRKSQLVEDPGIEKLHVRVLKNESDAAAKIESERLIVELRAR